MIVSVIVIHIGVAKIEVNVQECLIQKGDQIPVGAAKHNHEPNEQAIRQKLFIAHLKGQIRENAMPIREIGATLACSLPCMICFSMQSTMYDLPPSPCMLKQIIHGRLHTKADHTW